MNLTGEMVTTLDLELVDPDGTVLATARLDGDAALAPSGHLSLFIDQIPWDQEIDFSDFMGLIRVRPSGAGSTTSRRCTRAGLRLVHCPESSRRYFRRLFADSFVALPRKTPGLPASRASLSPKIHPELTPRTSRTVH